jgi:hypothetical protein
VPAASHRRLARMNAATDENMQDCNCYGGIR